LGDGARVPQLAAFQHFEFNAEAGRHSRQSCTIAF
jgi:hypothetical protein